MFRSDGPPRFTEFNFNHVKKIGGQMRTKKLLSAFAVMLFAFSVVAQEKPGSVAALEFQKPKNGMVAQYENGRKQKAVVSFCCHVVRIFGGRTGKTRKRCRTGISKAQERHGGAV